jgi:hypothetical protein
LSLHCFDKISITQFSLLIIVRPPTFPGAFEFG